MFGNPLLIPQEPSSVFSVLFSESDPSPLVVNLLTAEALVARHKGRTSQIATGTVVRAGVVVVCHVLKPQIQIVSPANVLAPIRTCCDQL